MSVVHKVYAYITRCRRAGLELLVFAHHGNPTSGLQPPGGTLEPGEAPETGVLREVAEESGLVGLGSPRLLAHDTVTNVEGIELDRAFFHLSTSGLPDAWQHAVTGTGEDEGFLFDYRWLPQAEWEQMHPWFSEHLGLLLAETA